MDSEVRVASRGSTLVLAKRLAIAIGDLPAALGEAFGEAYAAIGAARIPTAGPPFVVYYGMPAGDTPFEVDVCAPVSRAPVCPPGWRAVELEGGTFASLVHVGPYDTVATSYEALGAWIGEHGLAVAGPPREVYLDGPETPPEKIRTVIEFPVREVAVAAPA